MNYPAEPLLPQRQPFQFIDDFVFCSENEFRSQFRIKQNELFVVHEELSESALLENMAQTVAAGNTWYQQQHANQHNPTMGFIGAIKKITIQRKPKVNEILQTQVQIIHEIGDARIADAKIFCQDILIASAELTIFVQQKKSAHEIA